MQNNEQPRLSKEQARGLIENAVMPELERIALLECVKFWNDVQIAYSCGFLSFYDFGDNIEKSVTDLSNAYISYATLLENREQIIKYTDTALTLNPETKFMLGFGIEYTVNYANKTRHGMFLATGREMMVYETPEEERERLAIIFNTRKANMK
ncbi:hypothetical protein J4477_04850 [Candidatus Pacearchaeota archaeon]|nr:hypothetical protein [Candidatus Pacearchaeota archaeon]